MRICSILTSLTSGGAEILVSNLSEQFAAAGHESLVLTLCDAATLGNSSSMERRLRQHIEGSGGRVQSLRLGRHRRLVSGAAALRQVLGEFQPDVIHAHTARAMPMLAFRAGHTPVVLTHHNSRFSFPPVLLRLFNRQVRGYVAINSEIRDHLCKLTRQPVHLIPNAPAMNFTSQTARQAPGAGSNGPARILSVAAISDQKNYHLLLQVAAIMRDRKLTPRLPRFTVAGGGPDLASLRELARTMGLADNVEFLGERLDIPDLLRESHLYLNTSRYEGCSIAILEAMAMALPVVATDVSGNRDQVTSGRTGFLVDEHSPEDIARAVARVLNEPDLYSRMSRAAMEEVSRYTIRDAARRHLDIYAVEAGTRTDPALGIRKTASKGFAF